MKTLSSLLLATRPKTLPANLVAVWAGCMIIWKFQEHEPLLGIQLNWKLALFTALSSLFIQIACNLFNDSLDAVQGKDTKLRQGPQRITASGAMSAKAVQGWAIGALTMACLFALPLILAQGWVVILIGLPCLFFAYGYTGGPYPLAYHGLGELFVLLFFGLVAVAGTVFVQIGWHEAYLPVYGAAFILGIQCGLLSCLLIEVNNIRDRSEDESTGKRTLAVRLGDSRARGLAMAFLVAPYATLRQTSIFLSGHNWSGVSWNLAWLAAIIVGGIIMLKLRTTPPTRKMNALLGLSSLHMILFLLALTL